MASEHPELASNPLSRVQQKWKLKRRYSKEAKAAAKQGAKAAKKTAAASGTATRRAAQFVTRHPVAVLVLLLLLLLCFLVSAVSSIFPHAWQRPCQCVIRHLLRLGGYGPAGGGRGLHGTGKRAGADGSEHRKHPSRL